MNDKIGRRYENIVTKHTIAELCVTDKTVVVTYKKKLKFPQQLGSRRDFFWDWNEKNDNP